MSDPRIRAALGAAVADVLESMFFIEPAGGAVEAPVGESVGVEIAFDGDPPGRFYMCLARAAAKAIAADFLGEDAEALSEQQSADVTLEMANMICGAVLSRLESSASFRLGSPQMAAGTGEPQGATRYTTETGNGALTVSIRMEARACRAIGKSGS